MQGPKETPPEYIPPLIASAILAFSGWLIAGAYVFLGNRVPAIFSPLVWVLEAAAVLLYLYIINRIRRSRGD